MQVLVGSADMWPHTLVSIPTPEHGGGHTWHIRHAVGSALMAERARDWIPHVLCAQPPTLCVEPTLIFMLNAIFRRSQPDRSQLHWH